MASTNNGRPGLRIAKGITRWVPLHNNKGISVTPTPKIRTLQPSYDSYRVLILGVGVTKIQLLHKAYTRFARDPKVYKGYVRHLYVYAYVYVWEETTRLTVHFIGGVVILGQGCGYWGEHPA